MNYTSHNPYTEKTFFSRNTDNVDVAFGKLDTLFQGFRKNSDEELTKRQVWIRKLADILDQKSDELSLIMTQEMGKPVSQSRSELKKCASLCRFYAENAPSFLETETRQQSSDRYTEVRYEPLGVVLSIMPWNFPFWQVFRCAVPALMAGNSVLLKHAPNVPQCSEAICEVMYEAGVPRSRFDAIYSDNETISKLIADSRIAAMTLTGSTRAGKAVGEVAGRNLKPIVLELGGSDPYLILSDADCELAVEKCVTSRMLNNGQSCIAAKRFLVLDDIYDAFLEKFTAKMKSYEMGNPEENETNLGPLARKDLRDTLHEQVTKSIDKGATPLLGCELPKGPGFFYPASILTDVKPGMPAFDEELFGPVAAIIRVQDENEAVQLANKTVYGLGSGIFTRDLEKAKNLASKLEAGNVFINDFVKSDPEIPFGGIKQSGVGRELGREGIQEFVNIKTVSIAY